MRSALVLSAFVVLYIALCVGSYTQKSATWDEPQQVTRGYLGWHGDHRTDPEHPPFLRLWAALPLLLMRDIKSDPTVIDKVTPADWVGIGQFQYSQIFLYKMNNADRLLYRARFMIVLLGALLGALVFAWTKEWLGLWPATGALMLYCFEPNLMAHASLDTTDMGIACFIFGTLYFLWRTCRKLSPGNLAGLAVFFALAAVSKFTTALLVPIFLLLLIIHSCRRAPWGRFQSRLAKLAIAIGILVGLALLSWGAVWAVYGFRYAPSANPNWVFHFENNSPFGKPPPAIARAVTWVEARRLFPNAFTQGFLLGQIKAQVRGAYFAGRISDTGWWYYFPAAFAIKTPVAVLLLLLPGLWVVGRLWRRSLDTAIFIVLPVVLYLGIVMTQKLNIGLRHILPIYPFVIMLCAVALAWLARRKERVWATTLAAVIILTGFEFFHTYPDELAFFNLFVGGADNGDKLLVDSNLDWGQDLKGLKPWMEDNNLDQINLCYFGTADPAYYKIKGPLLPGSLLMNTSQSPELPGYVAISATNLRGVYFSQQMRQFYAPLLAMQPVTKIGHSIYIYRIEKPWWK